MNKLKFVRIFSLKGVPIQIHWTLILVMFLISLIGFPNLSLVVLAVILLFVVLVHELGHMWFVSRYGLETIDIKLYPLHGVCTYVKAETEYENSVIAWGGVVAQAIVFVPCIISYSLFSELLPSYLSGILLYLGYGNLLLALFNLLPITGFDGSRAWKAIPLFYKFRKSNHKKKNHLKVVK